MIWLLIIVCWVLPMVVCGMFAKSDGKNVPKVVACAFLLGWIGGLLALVLLRPEEEGGVEDEAERRRKEKRYGELKSRRERDDAFVKSERGKRLYEELVEGKRRG